jgi:hypothetical protein
VEGIVKCPIPPPLYEGDVIQQMLEHSKKRDELVELVDQVVNNKEVRQNNQKPRSSLLAWGACGMPSRI